MKKLLSILASVLMVLAFVTPVSADTIVVAQDADGLKSLINNSEEGKVYTIRIGEDFVIDSTITIPENKDIVIDFNNKKITVDNDFSGRPFTIQGKLTVTGNGTVDTQSSDTAYGVFDNYGKLYIYNGEFISSVNASGAVVKNRPGSYSEIYNGSFYGSPTSVYNEGVTKIYGGLFDGRSCSSCNSNSWGYTIQSHWKDKNAAKPELYFYDGTVIGVQGGFSSSAGYAEIYDGEFSTVACKVHSNGSTAFYALYVAGESGKVETHIYGGEFKSESKVAVYVGNSNDGGEKRDAIVYITGGTFTSGSDSEAIKVDNDLGGLEITGGNFYFKNGNTVDVKKWLGDNYSQDEEGNIIHDHTSSLSKIDYLSPTCTKDGNIAYWHCTVCDKYFKDEGLTQEITKEDTILKATGHKYTTTPTWSWNEDNIKAEATFVCLNDETHKEVLEAKVTSVTEDPTVDKEGKITYTATVTFEGKEYTDAKEVVLAKLPSITSGNNSSWNTNSSDGLTFTSDAEFKDFLKVLVDDKEVDNKYYTVKEGSTIVTLSNDFLKTLSVGKHTLSIVSTNGTATANFTIEAASVTVPDTGNDITNTYLFSLSAILSLGFISAVLLKKRYSR